MSYDFLVLLWFCWGKLQFSLTVLVKQFCCSRKHVALRYFCCYKMFIMLHTLFIKQMFAVWLNNSYTVCLKDTASACLQKQKSCVTTDIVAVSTGVVTVIMACRCSMMQHAEQDPGWVIICWIHIVSLWMSNACLQSIFIASVAFYLQLSVSLKLRCFFIVLRGGK